MFPALKLVDGARRKVLYLAGVDQNTGQVTQPEEVIPLLDFAGDARAADWSPDSERLVVQGFEEPDQHTLYTVRRTGGRLQRVHAFVSEHRISGIGVSPDWTRHSKFFSH